MALGMRRAVTPVERPIPEQCRETGLVIINLHQRSIQAGIHSPITLSVLAVAESKVGAYAPSVQERMLEQIVKWIKSEGGPLICVEKEMATLWQGVHGSSASGHATTEIPSDYDRACAVTGYLGMVDMPRRRALILGDMPLETTVWCPSSGFPLILRLFYIDDGVDLLQLLKAHGSLDFTNPIESIDCEFESGQMVIFDSAVPGHLEGHARLTFDVRPGSYRILTKVFAPDSRTSVLIHKFQPKAI